MSVYNLSERVRFPHRDPAPIAVAIHTPSTEKLRIPGGSVDMSASTRQSLALTIWVSAITSS